MNLIAVIFAAGGVAVVVWIFKVLFEKMGAP